MSEENIKQNATCRTDGCSENGKLVIVEMPPVSYLVCGLCGFEITDISLIN
jgi:hypothetical protein